MKTAKLLIAFCNLSPIVHACVSLLSNFLYINVLTGVCSDAEGLPYGKSHTERPEND